MTSLRQKMIDGMLMHGFADRTQSSYLDAVFNLAKHYRQSPDGLTPEQIQHYFLYLIKDRGLSPASCRLYLNALKFLYVHWSPTLPQGAGVDLLADGESCE